jgi:hypothetical protein
MRSNRNTEKVGGDEDEMDVDEKEDATPYTSANAVANAPSIVQTAGPPTVPDPTDSQIVAANANNYPRKLL